MNIRILGYLPASHLLQQEPSRWDALVILDQGCEPTDFVAQHARRHLFLHFDDVDGAALGRQPVTIEQIEQGLAFAEGSSRLLVSCRAGQSRSAAMAYLIACRYGGVPSAVALIDPRRHRPNRLVVRLGSSVLADRLVADAFDNWQREHQGIVLADYYHEMEREIEALEAAGAVNRIVVN